MLKPLDVLTIVPVEGDLLCPACEVALDRTQLDGFAPHQLIAICPECLRSLLLYETADQWARATALVLPERDELLASAPAA